tara:strand:+ start:44 stop:511 length:468 start_codon:yes stop_codon:yes gene_type:complete
MILIAGVNFHLLLENFMKPSQMVNKNILLKMLCPFPGKVNTCPSPVRQQGKNRGIFSDPVLLFSKPLLFQICKYQHGNFFQFVIFAVASFTPRVTNKAPLIFINHLAAMLFDLNFLLITEAKTATIKHQIVPVVMNTNPRMMNDRVLSGLSGEIN